MNNFLFCVYSFILFVLIMETPNKIAYMSNYTSIFTVVGAIGLYRYGIWAVHFIRAQLYERNVYSKIRKQAALIPEEAWKPDRLYFILASYREERTILYNSIKSIIHEASRLNLPVTICMGSVDPHDEQVIIDAVRGRAKVVFIRQNDPNKRLQMGSALRSLVRQGIKSTDYVVFMDSDTVIQPGCLEKCLPVFALRPDMDALTTNEKAVVVGSGFLANIFNLRFSLRNFHMQSLALSGKVLCLTGRFSIYRAGRIITEEFISRIERDYIYDWYWGKIQFLTGDDKSTWFSLLKDGSTMLYIPDA